MIVQGNLRNLVFRARDLSWPLLWGFWGLSSVGCASVQGKAVSNDLEPVNDVVRLIGRFNMGHACPVVLSDGTRYLLTAAHVMDPAPFEKDVPLYPARYSDGRGHEGKVMPLASDASSDLAVYVAPDVLGNWYRVASTAPKPGDEVKVLGYKWDTRQSILAERTFTAKVTRVVAGHIVLDEDTKPGSSGSCVINSSKEAVGILVWGIGADYGPGSGVAVGIWGNWAVPK